MLPGLINISFGMLDLVTGVDMSHGSDRLCRYDGSVTRSARLNAAVACCKGGLFEGPGNTD